MKQLYRIAALTPHQGTSNAGTKQVWLLMALILCTIGRDRADLIRNVDVVDGERALHRTLLNRVVTPGGWLEPKHRQTDIFASEIFSSCGQYI